MKVLNQSSSINFFLLVNHWIIIIIHTWTQYVPIWPSVMLTNQPLPWQKEARLQQTSSATPHWLQPTGMGSWVLGGRDMYGGWGVAWMSMLCPSYTGARDWENHRQGVEALWPLDLAQNYTWREIKLQKTPRDGAEHREGDADAQDRGTYGADRDMGAHQGHQRGDQPDKRRKS